MAKTKDNGLAEASQAIVPVPAARNQNPAIIRTLADAMLIAENVARYSSVAGINNQGQALVKILCGFEMGFGPFASLTGVNIINGKPGPGALLMSAAIKRSERYDYRSIEQTRQRCELAFFERNAQGIMERAGPNISATIEEMIECGVAISGKTKEGQPPVLKDNWRTSADDMLFATCLRKGFRRYFPHLLGGIPIYDEDEMSDPVTVPQEAIAQDIARGAYTEAEIVLPSPSEPVEDPKLVAGNPGPTGEQFTRYDDLMVKLRPSAVRMSQVFANKGVTDFIHLSPEQAEDIIESMEKGWQLHQENLAKKQSQERADAIERAKEAGRLKEPVPTLPGTSSPEAVAG